MPPPPAPKRDSNRPTIPVDRVTLGMFIAELDRPWLGTPFALEGMLITREAQIVELRKLCRFVRLDLERSSAEVQQAFRKVAAREEKSEGLLGGLLGKLRGAVGLDGRRGRVEREPETPPEATAASLRLPPGMSLQKYPEPIPMAEARPRAEKAVTHTAEALDSVMSALRENVVPDFTHIGNSAAALVESMIENPDAMMLVSELRRGPQGAYERALKTALNLLALGRHLGFPRAALQDLALIGMLADIGNTQLPQALLDKPGPLTPAEAKVVRSHVELGLGVLRKGFQISSEVETGILEHHERMDGSGYPRGLRGEQISVYGRMAAVADCFAAMISERAHAHAMAPLDAIMELYKLSGPVLHEPIVEQLVQAIGAFPVGTLVELSNGEIAVVLSRNKAKRMEPRVLVLAGSDKQPLATPVERDLSTDGTDAENRPPWIWRGLPDGAYDIDLHGFYAGADDDRAPGA